MTITRTPLSVSVFATSLLCVAPGLAFAESRPNIILMVADDLGYGCVELFRTDGPPSPQERERQSESRLPPIATPNIDRLGRDGLIMTDFYANCSVCSPTRAAIITGRYQHRTGIVNVLGQTSHAFARVFPDAETPFRGLSPENVSVAEVLRDGGYRTAMIGKWHLGPLETPGYHPMDHGFEHFVGVEGSAGNMFSMIRNGRSILFRGRERAEASGEYWTYVQAHETLDFIRKDDDRPFFIYLPFTAPHPSSRIGPGDREEANRWDYQETFRTDYPRIHKELVEALDEAVGMIHDGLIEMGLAEDTLILFTSDNGQNGYGYPPLNQHMGKQTVYEGGVRVPMVVHWPNAIEPGRISDVPTMTMDLFPTFLGLSGISLPSHAKPLDGADLSPLLRGDGEIEERLLFWEKPYQVWMEYFGNRLFAVRDGDWKLLRSHINRPPELYNVRQDKAETENLAAQYPERVERMTRAFEAWRQEVFADMPYGFDEFLHRLKEAGIVTEESTAKELERY